LRVDFDEGFFTKTKLREEAELLVDFTKVRGLFCKRPGIARSGLSARPIRRARKAGDVATLAGLLLVAHFI
jgi:hypothetical protein